MNEHDFWKEYERHIHAAQDYIEEHISESVTVEQLSMVAGFSKFHFARIFQAVRNETPAHYIMRIRLEKAQFLLAHRTDKNLTEIAYEVGFSDSAVFSRAFHRYFQISPSTYRKQYSKICKESIAISDYNAYCNRIEQQKQETYRECDDIVVDIGVETLRTMQAVYVRHTGNYEELADKYTGMMETLCHYAKKEQYIVGEENWFLAMYHDNPEFGEEDQFRTSLCMTVPDYIKIKETERIGRIEIEGGLYVVGHFRIFSEQYPKAWNRMYREWIIGKGYVPRNAAPFEVYRNNPNEEKNNIHEVDIYLPVESNLCSDVAKIR